MGLILLVEDNDDLRDLLGGLLKRGGHRVIAAEHGKAALERLEAMPESPTLVLMDLMMPVMSGFELLALLRASPRWSALPVVVLSAIADRTKPEGARAYVQKPPAPEQLLSLIAQISAEGSRPPPA